MASLLKRFAYAGKEGKPAADAAAKELRKSKDNIQRRFAITALGSLQGEAAPWVEGMTAALSDEDAGVRYHAAISLAALGPALAEYSAALAKAMTDADPGVRLYVVQALGQLGDKAADQGDALVEAVRSDKDTHVRLAATRALLRIRPSSAASVADIFARELRRFEEELVDEVFYRVCSAEGLGLLGSSALPHAATLRKALGDAFYGVRIAAARTLAALGAEGVRPAAEVLAKLAKDDGREDVRVAASSALACLEAADALRSDDASMRYWAVSNMAGSSAAAEPRAPDLAVMLQDSEVENRRLAAVALEGIRQAAAPHHDALLLGLEDRDGAVRVAAMRALVASGQPEAVEQGMEVAARSLAADDASLRAAAAECLGCAGLAAKPHAEALAAVLGDEAYPVRLAAVRALAGAGRLGVRASGDTLGRLALKDPDIDVRRAATACLREYRLDKRYGLPDQAI